MRSEENFQAESFELDRLFQEYRTACPDVEPGTDFMPRLWQRIEGRRNLWFHFSRLGTNALAISAGLCLVLLAMNLAAPPQVAANYVDALLPDDAVGQVYYSEAQRPAPEGEAGFGTRR